MKTKTAARTRDSRNRLIWGIAILIVAAALLGGCGKKGDPEAPDSNSTYPDTYPAE